MQKITPFYTLKLRKAAWTIDELQESIFDIYVQKGRQGLGGIKSVGKSLS
jgi:hypothetical protein